MEEHNTEAESAGQRIQDSRRTGKKPVRRVWIAAAILTLIVLTAAGITARLYIYPELKIRRPAYAAGVSAMENGDYREAIRQFRICGMDYKDAEELTGRCAEQQMEADLERIGELEVPKGEEAQAVSDLSEFVSIYDRSRFSEEEMDRLRTYIGRLFEKLYRNDLSGTVDEIVGLLSEAYGSSEVWEQQRTFAAAECAEGYPELKKALKTITELAGEGAPDAETHLDSVRGACLKEADASAERYTQSLDLSDADEAVDLYMLLKEDVPEAGKGLDGLCEKLQHEAENAADEQAYRQAESIYQVLSDAGWPGTEDAMKELYYRQGEACYQEDDYLGAVRSWYLASGCRDADERCAEAKYRYCEAHADQPDENVLRYIEELAQQNYPGSEGLRARIFSWHAEVSASFPDEEETHTFLVSVRLSGGEEGEETGLQVVIEGPEMEQLEYVTDETYAGGETAEIVVDLPDTQEEIDLSGYLIEVYDDNGDLIGSSEESGTGGMGD